MYIVELFGGPMDGLVREARTLESWIEVNAAPSPELLLKYAGTDEGLPHFKHYYSHMEEDTRLGDTGKIIYIYRFEKKEPEVDES